MITQSALNVGGRVVIALVLAIAFAAWRMRPIPIGTHNLGEERTAVGNRPFQLGESLTWTGRDPFVLTPLPAVETSALSEQSLDATPQLRLVAIAGGPPWTALISGFAGSPRPFLVATGDSVLGVLVDSVVPTGALLRWNGRQIRLTLEREVVP